MMRILPPRGFSGFSGFCAHSRFSGFYGIRGLGGFTLIELMVGLAVGLWVVAGAMGWAGHTLGQMQRQLQEWQMHRELRALALQLQMELRRAGAHGRPTALVWRQDTGATANAFSTLTLEDGGSTLRFSRATDDNATQPGTSGQTGFRWAEGRMDQSLGGRFQPLTDPGLMEVTSFSATVQTLAHAGTGGCAGTVHSRTVELSLQAQPPQQPQLQQRLALTVHLRNDVVAGGC
ncbi:prepilin peptidase dependent protein B [Roseateles sp. YR242]|uniref:PilW family protein n=1 Tax=Roseateles sp. YR242 TaxID=1855305 RepID=UPI0008AE6EC1|nr:prepilin-type N-terminal cleavage/methylation domain-containing protein [Roseateles sp. YR242]SEL07709.1 prepilin peptidase dependent protein B [Roseateles sp. YR242]